MPRRTLSRGALVACALVALVALSGAAAQVAADPAHDVPPRTSVLAERSSLALGKIAASGPTPLRKLATAPAPKPPPPETPEGTALALGGGLHPRVKAAYQNAQRFAASRWPRCSLRWTILAAIGAVESGHGAHQEGAVIIDETGVISPPIFGPTLNGRGGFGYVADSDNGELDGDPHHDRALGPMQIIPSSWQRHGQDANGDGIADPHSIDDAAAAAASYLCTAAGGSLRDVPTLDRAIFSYNHSDAYVLSVRLQLERLDRAHGFGVLAPVVTEPPEPEPAPEEAPPAPPPPTAAPSPLAALEPSTTTTTTTPTPVTQGAPATSTTVP